MNKLIVAVALLVALTTGPALAQSSGPLRSPDLPQPSRPYICRWEMRVVWRCDGDYCRWVEQLFFICVRVQQ